MPQRIFRTTLSRLFIHWGKSRSEKWTNLTSVTEVVSEENAIWSHVFHASIFKWRICSSALTSQYNILSPLRRKSVSDTLFYINLIYKRLMNKSQEFHFTKGYAIQRHRISAAQAPFSVSQCLVSIKSKRRELDNLVASHIQTVGLKN